MFTSRSRLLRDRQQLLQRHPARLAPPSYRSGRARRGRSARPPARSSGGSRSARRRRRARGVHARGRVDLLHEPHVEPEARRPRIQLSRTHASPPFRCLLAIAPLTTSVSMLLCRCRPELLDPVEDVQERGALAGEVVSARRRERPRAQLVQRRAPPAARSRPPPRSRPRRRAGRKQFSPGRQNERLPMQSGHTTTVPTAIPSSAGR